MPKPKASRTPPPDENDNETVTTPEHRPTITNETDPHNPFDVSDEDDEDSAPVTINPLVKLRPFLIKGVDESNTKIMKYYTNTDVLEDISEWELQRTINEEHWKTIYAQHIKYYEKHKCFFFIGAITCCYIPDSDKLALVDGQHRLYAIRELAKKAKYKNKIMFALDVVMVENDDEIHDIFCSINNVLQIDVSTIPRRNLTAKIISYLHDKHKAFGKENTDKRHIRPFLTKTEFVKKINNTFIIHHIKNSDELIALIAKKNAEYAKKPSSFFPQITPNLYKKAMEINFYLGLFKNFEWIDEINSEYIKTNMIH